MRLLIAVGLLAMSACASDPHHDWANKPPVYGERPGETTTFAEQLIFGPANLTQSTARIERRQ